MGWACQGDGEEDDEDDILDFGMRNVIFRRHWIIFIIQEDDIMTYSEDDHKSSNWNHEELDYSDNLWTLDAVKTCQRVNHGF